MRNRRLRASAIAGLRCIPQDSGHYGRQSSHSEIICRRIMAKKQQVSNGLLGLSGGSIFSQKSAYLACSALIRSAPFDRPACALRAGREAPTERGVARRRHRYRPMQGPRGTFAGRPVHIRDGCFVRVLVFAPDAVPQRQESRPSAVWQQRCGKIRSRCNHAGRQRARCAFPAKSEP